MDNSRRSVLAAVQDSFAFKYELYAKNVRGNSLADDTRKISISYRTPLYRSFAYVSSLVAGEEGRSLHMGPLICCWATVTWEEDALMRKRQTFLPKVSGHH